MNGLLYIFSFTMGLVEAAFNGVYYRLPGDVRLRLAPVVPIVVDS